MLNDDMDEVVGDLEEQIADLTGDLEDERVKVAEYRDRLETAVDILCKCGYLVNTPSYRLRWMETGQGLLNPSN